MRRGGGAQTTRERHANKGSRGVSLDYRSQARAKASAYYGWEQLQLNNGLKIHHMHTAQEAA